jgi:predicted metal-dependent hydrolase
MEGFNLPNDIISMVLENLTALYDQKAKHQPKRLPPSKVTEVIQKLERKKEKLNYMFLNTESMGEAEYNTQLTALDEELDKIKYSAKIESRLPSVGKKEALKRTEVFLKDFKKFWNSGLSREDQRAWIQMVIKRIWVKNKKVVAIEPHDEYRDLFSVQNKAIGQSPYATPK